MSHPEPTQELESQVIREYYSKEQSEHPIETSDERRTYHTGETGYVDLLNIDGSQDDRLNFQNSRPATQNSSGVDNGSDDELALPTQTHTDAPTSPFRLAPLTPGLAGSKRSASGDIISSDIRTPAPDLGKAFAALGASKPPQLTQIFQETQADFSTPYPNRTDLSSDPVFDRPSPDFSREIKSSPAAVRSSVQLKNFPEPQTAYLSRAESQKARLERESREEKQRPDGGSEDSLLDADCFGHIEDRRQTRARQNRQAREDLSKIWAPAQYKSEKRRKLQHADTAVGLMSVTPGRYPDHAIMISDDKTPGGNDNGEESARESLDEYDELGEAILSSDRILHENERKSATKSPASTCSSKRDEHDRNLVNHSAIRTGSKSLSPQNATYARKGSDSIAVENSQPEVVIRGGLISSSQPARSSQEDSRDLISQSQPGASANNSRLEPGGKPTEHESHERSVSVSTGDGAETHTSAGNGAENRDPSSSPPRNATSRKHQRQIFADQPCKTAGVGSTDINEDFDDINHAPDARVRRAQPAPHENQHMSVKVVDTPSMRSSHSDHRFTIPETSPPEVSVDKQNLPVPPGKERTVLGSLSQSNSTSTYQSARTQVNPSPSKRGFVEDSSNSQSPAKYRSHINKLRDIANQPTPPDAQASYGIDFNIMNEDDVEFEKAVKPVRTYQSKVKLRRSTQKTGSDTPQNATEVISSPSRSMHSDKENTTPSISHEGQIASTSGTVPRSNGVAPETTARQHESSRSKTRTHSPRLASQAAQPLHNNQDPASLSEVGDSIAPAIDTSNGNQPIPLAAGHNVSSPTGQLIAPTRILARFKGAALAFYPAICQGLTGPANSLYKVVFDDNTSDDVEPHLVKSLELRQGDLVKVDQEGMRKTTFVVRGLQNTREQSSNEANGSTDIYGNNEVVLEPRQRDCSSGDHQSLRRKAIHVPIYKLYIPYSLWPRLEDRTYTHLEASESRPNTPSIMSSVPSTPSTRTRRQTLTSEFAKNGDLESKKKALKSSLFSKMAFALTFQDTQKGDQEKARLVKLIEENGGQVLNSGFDCLFDNPSGGPLSSLSNSGHNGTIAPSELAFAALISDAPSRRPKYMQALALHLPCLFAKWIIDSVASAEVLAWDTYLLPAGETSRFGNKLAMRSRVFPPEIQFNNFIATSTHLNEIIGHRISFLQSHNVILVMRKKLDEEAKKSRVFLLYALGAQRATIVKDMDAAKKLIDEDSAWDWVYVDDEGKGLRLEEVRSTLLEPKKGSKKRKRTSNGEGSAESRQITILRNESVVQSLILGKFWDAQT